MQIREASAAATPGHEKGAQPCETGNGHAAVVVRFSISRKEAKLVPLGLVKVLDDRGGLRTFDCISLA